MSQYEPYHKLLAERGIDIDVHEIVTVQEYADSIMIIYDGSIFVKKNLTSEVKKQ